MTSAEYNQAFKKRTKIFALGVIRLCESLPKTYSTSVLGKQLVRSATSVAANYRASCIARSDRERFAKLCIVVEEADESLFWLEMLLEAGFADHAQMEDHLQEANELVKVFFSYRQKLKAAIDSANKKPDAPNPDRQNEIQIETD